MITSAQIHEKEFARKFRGYDELKVDEFLDQIAEYIDTLTRENSELREKLKLAYMKNLEDTLRETLITAQRSAEETGRQASLRAEETIGAANEQARQIVLRAQRDTAAAEKKIEELQRQASLYRSNFRMMVEAQLQVLEDSDIGTGKETPENPTSAARRRGVLLDEPLNPRRSAEQGDEAQV